MTTKVITVTPDVSVREIARLLIENGISALPVVNKQEQVVGMVSEGDLTGRTEIERQERRDWWLNMFAEGEALAPEFLADMTSQERKAYEIMSSPVITAQENTEVSEIARLLTENHIKRVPVMKENRITGIVSRADIVRAFADLSRQVSGKYMPEHGENFLSKAFTSLDQHFHGNAHKAPGKPAAHETVKLSVKDFQTLVSNFEHAKTLAQEEAHHQVTERHKQQVKELISHHIDDAGWQLMLHHAHDVAQQGGKEYMLLRFPNELCSDGGRAINVGEPGWHETLRGEAAEIYSRWEQDLKPQGFRFSARTLEYPGGFPGDIGLFLVWG